MQPNLTTIGRFWRDREGRLWLQEHVDKIIISFIDGYYSAVLPDVRPERLLIVPHDTEHGLRLLDEPIAETLKREGDEPWTT